MDDIEVVEFLQAELEEARTGGDGDRDQEAEARHEARPTRTPLQRSEMFGVLDHGHRGSVVADGLGRT